MKLLNFWPYPFPAQPALLCILLCLTSDDFTRQWGTPWAGKGYHNIVQKLSPFLSQFINN